MLCMLGPRLIRPLKCRFIQYAVLICSVFEVLLIDVIAGIHSTCVAGRTFLAPGASSTDPGGSSADSVPAIRVDVYHKFRQVKPCTQGQE